MFKQVRRSTAAGLRRAGKAMEALAARVQGPSWRPSAEDLRLVATNTTLHGMHAGRPGFVIGNGPSLQEQDLAPLADQVTFVANGFWRHPLMAAAETGGDKAWQPAYYSIIDPLYFDGSPAMQACFETIRKRARRCTFFVPARNLPAIREQRLLPIESLRTCLFRGGWTDDGPRNDLSRPLPVLQSVSLMGIVAAMYTGCNPVYLLGMDHDWLSRPVISCHHFYADVSVANHPVFEAIERGGAETYLDNLEGMTALYRGYYHVAELAEASGVRIFNATRGGYLDVFPRVTYEDVIPAAADAQECGTGFQPVPAPVENRCHTCV